MMQNIQVPTLIVDEEKCRRNIRKMAEKARNSGIVFRPHFKTHQSRIVGSWFREVGVEKITVSSLNMADFFAQDQWNDIMVAFPVNVREMDKINKLAAQIRLGILIADKDTLPVLNEKLVQIVDCYVKIDIGTYRTGVDAHNTEQIQELLDLIKEISHLNFRGFVAHAGHTYQTQSLNDVHRIYKKGVELLQDVKNHFQHDYPSVIVSWGDTPSCSLVEEFAGVDEIRPGNFVFYDLMQFHLGSCDWDQIAIVVAAPVVARHKERNEIVLYAGSVHLSKDSFTLQNNGIVYGEIVKFTGKGWERYPKPIYVDRLSQEHGIFYCPDEYWEIFKPGDLVGIIPVHSCLTADILQHYYDTDGIMLE